MVFHWSKPLTVEEMYGDWDYEAAVEALERSLNPRRGSSIFDTVESLGVQPGDTLLDIGGRDGAHGLVMAERFGCRVVSVDPSQANIADGLKAVAEHEYGHMVDMRLGAMEDIPTGDDEFKLVFSRDMIGHVEDLETGMAECARVLVPGGAMVVHDVVGTELLEPVEAQRLCAEVATVPERLSVESLEAAFLGAGFAIEDLDLVGSEWYEANQEAGRSPNYMLQISRLRRAKEQLLEELGESVYRSMHANALWGAYILIGKLETRLYVLRNARS